LLSVQERVSAKEEKEKEKEEVQQKLKMLEEKSAQEIERTGDERQR
jgi:hypothetical protein